MAGTKGQANEIYSFSNLVKAQPSDRRVSGRQISNDQRLQLSSTPAA
jgi:hypothetical protein